MIRSSIVILSLLLISHLVSAKVLLIGNSTSLSFDDVEATFSKFFVTVPSITVMERNCGIFGLNSRFGFDRLYIKFETLFPFSSYCLYEMFQIRIEKLGFEFVQLLLFGFDCI